MWHGLTCKRFYEGEIRSYGGLFVNIKRYCTLFLAFACFLILSACSDVSSEADDQDVLEGTKDGKITIAQINWPENIAVTNMWKAILEEEGYDVELILVEMGPQMASLAEGDLDIAPEIWLPVQDKTYFEEYKDEVDFAEEPWYDNGQVGLVVPTYMEDIHSIEDLNKHKELFEAEIVGFEPGAGTMLVTEDVIDEYDLDFELVPSSEAAMIVSIREADKHEDPIVAPLWKPHYVFSEVDLKFLDDPKLIYGETEEIFMATRENFDKDYPEVDKWLRNWKLNDDELGSLMLEVQEHESDPLTGAKKWVENNRDVIKDWME